MTTYAFRDEKGDVTLLAPEFSRPIPVHAQTPGALRAVETMRAIGLERIAQREMDQIVTDHGRPPIATYERDVVTANAKKLATLAEAHGFEVHTLRFPDACRVEGIHRGRRVGFTATWTRGRASGASWHEPWRYGIVADTRPVGVNKMTLTGLAGKRAAGIGTTRLTILASPVGLPINHATLNERITS